MSKAKRAQIILDELKKLYPTPTIALTYNSNWELLVAVALSARCTDKKVNEVTERLFQKYTTLDDYINVPIEELEQDVKQTGFYKNKAKNLKGAAKIVKEKFGGVVPNSMKDLESIPGVGHKTANVIMAEGFGVAAGIAVDTHVTRLANKFGLTTSTNPVYIEQDLMQVFPKDDWLHITHRLIMYGREYSPAHKKHSDEDPISQALLSLG